jgi:Xaa-Pro aminopeptidase
MRVNIGRLRSARMQRTRSFIKQSGLDALLVNTWDNVRYVTDIRPVILTEWYADGHYCVMTPDGEPTVYGYSSGEDLTAKFVDSSPFPFFSPMTLPDKWADGVAGVLRGARVTSGRVGIDFLPLPLGQKLVKLLPNLELVPVFTELLRLRAVKNEEEIKLIRKAAQIVDSGIAKGLRSLRQGITEQEVFAKIIETTMRMGSEGVPFSAIVSSGKKALKDELAGDRKLRKGDFVAMDVGAIFHGYNGDAARTGVVGKPGKHGLDLHRDLREAFLSGVKKLRPGVYASDVDAAIRTTLKELRRPVYGHPTGHGVGLRGIELPYLGSRKDLGANNMRLEPGMVATLEPTARDDKVGVFRMEDMFLVTDNGNETLTKSAFLDDDFE